MTKVTSNEKNAPTDKSAADAARTAREDVAIAGASKDAEANIKRMAEQKPTITRVPLQTIGVHRNGETVNLPPGKAAKFTKEEIKELEALEKQPGGQPMFRKAKDETADVDDKDGE